MSSSGVNETSETAGKAFRVFSETPDRKENDMKLPKSFALL
jgi:hypothetical protein